MQAFVNYTLYEVSYLTLYLLVTGYFLFLYFVVGQCFVSVCNGLFRLGILTKITGEVVSGKQKVQEVKNSIRSILVFGFSGIPVVYGIRAGFITLAPDSFINVIVGVILLNCWNEVHFFLMHRLLHSSFFMKHVHYVHHQSVVPTIYSVFSFHWFEALLLSTVPISIIPFFAFAPTAILIYPLTSIFFNFCGHCNYQIGSGNSQSTSWLSISTNHHKHHYSFAKTYGFVTTLLDKLLIKISKT